jgi:hypothetical protein
MKPRVSQTRWRITIEVTRLLTALGTNGPVPSGHQFPPAMGGEGFESCFRRRFTTAKYVQRDGLSLFLRRCNLQHQSHFLHIYVDQNRCPAVPSRCGGAHPLPSLLPTKSTFEQIIEFTGTWLQWSRKDREGGEFDTDQDAKELVAHLAESQRCLQEQPGNWRATDLP